MYYIPYHTIRMYIYIHSLVISRKLRTCIHMVGTCVGYFSLALKPILSFSILHAEEAKVRTHVASGCAYAIFR